MSSTTPGQDAGDEATQVNPQARPGPTSQEDRSAIRTSLAERFAAAKGVAEHPVVPRPDDTAAAGGTTSPARSSSTGVFGGSAPAPRYGATAETAQHTQAAPAPRRETADTGAAAGGRPAPRPSSGGPRRVRLSVARVDPWSVMKLSFLLSIAVGIGIVVAAAAMWLVLDSMHVFADVEELLLTLDSENFLRLMDYVQFDRVISAAAIIAVVDILLLTALSTLGAFLYNIVAALVGGVHLTLTDD